jgi:predicted RNA-binding Zn-ribbon protein involved in translation (DUF1610 family)
MRLLLILVLITVILAAGGCVSTAVLARKEREVPHEWRALRMRCGTCGAVFIVVAPPRARYAKVEQCPYCGWSDALTVDDGPRVWKAPCAEHGPVFLIYPDRWEGDEDPDLGCPFEPVGEAQGRRGK